MIKLVIISFAVLSTLASTCNSDSKKQEEELSCLDKLKAQILALPPQMPSAVIWEYTYNGATVYLVPAPCCDQFNPVYSTTCEVICHPDGGITGKGDGQCNDFHAIATGKKLAWKDSRAAK